jgi:D-glycero-alpha-D-manno-heptose 1-phosphate guanylyltransferase
MECIVLAGGLGTRLQGVIGAQPKCMAPICGKPFLQYLFDYLDVQNCSSVTLSLGFRHEAVIEWVEKYDWPFRIDYVVETEPLGTGGGIALALKQTLKDDVFVLNGDTMFRADLNKMMEFHLSKKSATTLALKFLQNFERYGVVKVDDNSCIQSFEEKKYYDKGLINGGIYIINKSLFEGKKLPEKFSFEQQYLEQFVNEGNFYGFLSEAYFIDIGVPNDYEQAQIDFQKL